MRDFENRSPAHLKTLRAGPLRRLHFLLAAVFLVTGCSSLRKKTPELSEMEGKKVALVEIESEATERKIIEVALVNQLVQHGSFILVSREEIEKARRAPDLKPTDWMELTRRVGADYALRAKVLQFDADVHEGYNKEEVEDTQLEAETGDARTERVFKAKAMEAKVRVELSFTRIFDGDTRTGVAESEDRVVKEAKSEAIHMPPKMRFLENLSNKAFKDFFEKYH